MRDPHYPDSGIGSVVDLTRAVELAKKRGDTAEVILALGRLGAAMRDSGQLDQAEELCREALTLATARDRMRDVAMSYVSLGLVALQRPDFTAARWCFMRTIVISRRLGLDLGVACAWSNLGRVYLRQGKLQYAEICALRGFRIADARGKADSFLLGTLGVTYLRQNRYRLASRMFRRAHAWERRTGSVQGVGRCLLYLGKTNERSRLYRRADVCFRAALDCYQRAGLVGSAGSAAISCGRVRERMVDLVTAASMYRLALRCYARVGGRGKVVALCRLASVSERLGEHDRAARARRLARSLSARLRRV